MACSIVIVNGIVVPETEIQLIDLSTVFGDSNASGRTYQWQVFPLKISKVSSVKKESLSKQALLQKASHEGDQTLSDQRALNGIESMQS